MMTSTAAITVTINVPAVCRIEANAPKCNLELVKTGAGTWIDSKRHYTVTFIDGMLTIMGPEATCSTMEPELSC